MPFNIRNFLNRLNWDTDRIYNKRYYEINYIHRGAPNDNLKVNCSEILKVNPSTFEIFDEKIGEIKIIPFHRILEIRDMKENKIIYKKKLK